MHYFDANASVITAVLESGERDINRITRKVEALKTITAQDNFKEIASTFKRVANIVKDIALSQTLHVDEALLQESAEIALYTDFQKVVSKNYEDYRTQLEALFGLKPAIDHFFDTVMVNVEDEKLKINRKNLIASVYKAFRNIAELKEVTV